MVKVLNLFSLSDDENVKKAKKLYVFPFMNGSDFYGAYGGSYNFPYFVMIEYRDF